MDVRSGLDPVDYKLINPNPDKDFSPERNRAIVEQTIRDTEKYFNVYNRANDKDLDNRIDIVSSYAVRRLSGGYTKDIKGYLGKEQYNAIIGEKLLSKLRVAKATNTLIKSDKLKIKKGILL
jgi:hypothetical protein